jgi:hypothetical protein
MLSIWHSKAMATRHQCWPYFPIVRRKTTINKKAILYIRIRRKEVIAAAELPNDKLRRRTNRGNAKTDASLYKILQICPK